MPRHPEHQPLKCSAEQHLWRQGLALAIYGKARTVTAGGERPFNANQVTLSIFFRAHKNAVLNAMNFLRKNGWLIPSGENEYTVVSHEEWVKRQAKEGKPSSCIEQKIVPPIPYRRPEEAA
jgi:hypothetical protein